MNGFVRPSLGNKCHKIDRRKKVIGYLNTFIERVRLIQFDMIII